MSVTNIKLIAIGMITLIGLALLLIAIGFTAKNVVLFIGGAVYVIGITGIDAR